LFLEAGRVCLSFLHPVPIPRASVRGAVSSEGILAWEYPAQMTDMELSLRQMLGKTSANTT